MSDGGDTGRDPRLDRIIALSDGIFAFAMTLLVIDVRLPAGTAEAQLVPALKALSPQYIAFAVSFAVIGLYWVGHRTIFAYIVRSDVRLVFLNLLLLATIAVMPFPTAVVGEFGHAPAAAVLYASSVAVTGLVMAGLWLYATFRRRLVPADLDRSVVRERLLRILVPVAVFAASIPVGLVRPAAAPDIWLALGGLILLLDLIVNGERSRRRRRHA